MPTTDIATAAPNAAANEQRKGGDSKRRMARPSTVAGEPQIDPAVPANSSTTPSPAKPTKFANPARVTKSAIVIALLQREQGATLPELIEATGWLPHTTRAALTGLKKKGHVIAREKRGDVTCYRIAPVAA